MAAEILDGERMRRAADGVDEPVLYRCSTGARSWPRKRYSDTLLMSAIRDLRERQQAAAPQSAAAPDAEPNIRVVVRQFSFPSDEPAKTNGNE